jgi:hypothetical protein
MSLAGHSASHCFTVTCHSLSSIAKWYRINCYTFILFTVQVRFNFMRCINLLCAEHAGVVRDCALRSLEGTLVMGQPSVFFISWFREKAWGGNTVVQLTAVLFTFRS